MAKKSYFSKDPGRVKDANKDTIKQKESVESSTEAKSESAREDKSVRLQAISDRARHDLSEDTLDFRPYVSGLVNFLRANDTEPPLAIAINGRWGQGKTSLMMMIDSELKKKNLSSKFRFATTWFNPWKYSEGEPVWGSFVDVITRCIRRSLGIWSRIKFEKRRFLSNFIKQFNLALGIRCIVLLALGYLLYWVVTDENMKNFTIALAKDIFKENAQKELTNLPYLWFIPFLGGLVLFYQLYFNVIKKFNLGLLEYLQETNFRDKIGTLAQFDEEMKHLNSCVPKKIRIVVFIDDLDRCKPGVLLEIIQALQLLHVSERCIFVLGLDLEIVAKTIEVGIPELREAVGREDGNLQHGRGYQFLEKIIHTRLTVPYYSENEINTFISRTLDSVNRQNIYKEHLSESSSIKESINQDSPEVKEVITKYGTIYFSNPRRLKRFINSFRLNVHLAQTVGLDESIELMARFLILTEKWPGLVEIFRKHPTYLDHLQNISKVKNTFGKVDVPPIENTDEQEAFDNALELFDQEEIRNLLVGNQPINSEKLINLSNWFGFQYYRFNVKNG